MFKQKSTKPSLINRLLSGIFFGLGASLTLALFSVGVYLVLAAKPGTINPTTAPPGDDVSWAPLMVDQINNRVGIGTTNPSEKLEVDGNIKLSGTLDGGSSNNVIQILTNNTVY